ncbi:uncharacterized protein LOC9641232 isoform X1 [Selaginella moellendorffii]|uniref:uncharacterized protein LOC9641232 isoform X1 n=1 Tax=Selaginella moellendorffii TaxID=88036 RepID=UPI000D1C5848|nr:uncharacterized protein LOC9641232 isoform X1 [Selaginella moellendorffii]|eukprot:XP_002994633.2 uncharacterized protein LOC9641232 isoform X1 [Selaginella moellendorffii]
MAMALAMALTASPSSHLKFQLSRGPAFHSFRVSYANAAAAPAPWAREAVSRRPDRGRIGATGNRKGNAPDGDNESLALKILRLDGWDVPWGYGVTTLGLLGWLVSFFVTGLATAVLGHNLGIDRREILDMDEQAAFILFSQVLQTITGLGTINLVTTKYQPLPSDMFVYDFRKPFDLQRGWLLWSGIGILCAGGAVVLTSIIVSSVNGELPPREDNDALSQLLPLIGVSPLSTASLIVVTGALAPLLEETVFRGFLLTSLTKRLPVPVAVVLSAAAFALAHLTPGEFPQLFALGIVIGFAYSKTHNMLTPILIHATWNSGVVVALTALSFQGYDLSQVLSLILMGS